MSRYRSRMGNDRKARREIGRRLRKGGVMMCMMITSAMLLSACSGGNSSSKNTTAAQTTEAAAEGGAQDSQNEVMGRVKSVSDTEITVEQGPGGAPVGRQMVSQVRTMMASSQAVPQTAKVRHPRAVPQTTETSHHSGSTLRQPEPATKRRCPRGERPAATGRNHNL